MQKLINIEEYKNNFLNFPDYYLTKYMDSDKYYDYYYNTIYTYLNNPNIYAHNSRAGTASIESREFDNSIIGLKTANINYVFTKESNNLNNIILVKEILDYSKNNRYEYLISKVNTCDLPMIQAFESNGFITVDSIVTFATPINDLSCQYINNNDYKVLLFDKKDKQYTDTLCNISKNAFTDDRFHNDPIISKEKADNVYFKWMENSCKNEHEPIFIAVNNSSNKPIGFLILNIRQVGSLKVGIILLIASDLSHKKRYVGYNMISKGMDYFKDNGIDVVQVGTQLTNIPAQRLYLKCGFKPVSSQTTLRANIDY